MQLSLEGAEDNGDVTFLVIARPVGCANCPEVSQRSSRDLILLSNLTVGQSYVVTAHTLDGSGAWSKASTAIPATPTK